MRKHILTLVLAIFCLGALAQSPCTITQLPYRVEMNESYPDLLECWTISSNSRFLYDEDYVMTLNLSAMESGCVITPPIDPSIPMNSIVVKWRMQGDYYNSCDYMEVSVGTDPTNESSFTPVGSANCPNGNDHDRIFEVSLQNYNGPGRYIRLRPTGNLGRCYLYEVSLEHYNDCYSPLVTDSWSADTTAYITWQPRGNETSWQYAYCQAQDTPAVWTATSQPAAYLNGLTPNTRYDFYLRSVCESSIGETAIPVSQFATECPDYLTIPYYEDFSNPLVRRCWTGVIAQHQYITDLIEYSPVQFGSIVAMPPIPPSVNIDTLMLAFEFRKSPGTELEVGVMDNPLDTSTFQSVLTVPPTEQCVPVPDGTEYNENWYYFDMVFSSYSDTGKYIAFRSEGSVIIRNIALTAIPPCVAPAPVLLTDISSNSATIDITSRGNEDMWEFRYGPPGFDPDTEGVSGTAAFHPFILEQLAPDTHYDIYVRAHCGTAFSNWSSRLSFHTLCSPIEHLPYIQNSNFRDCWSSIGSTYEQGYADVILGQDSIGIGGGSVNNPFNGCSYAIMPPVADTMYLQNKQISFRLPSGIVSIEVGVMDNCLDFNTFVPVASVIDTANTVSFFNYQGSGRFIAFRCCHGIREIDDVVLDVAPPCGVPENLSVSNILGTSAYVSWDSVTLGYVDDYTVFYAPEGSTHFETRNTSETHLMLSGLIPDTAYIVRVRCNCTEGGGAYAEAAFSTNCGSSSIVSFGNGLYRQDLLPASPSAGNTYSQQLFLKEEMVDMLAVGDISELQFEYSSNNLFYNRPAFISVFLGETDQNSFSSDSSWIDFSQLTKVFEDTVTFSVSDQFQWLSIVFDSAYHYDGQQNLVVAVLNYSVPSLTTRYIGSVTSENLSIYYMDPIDFDLGYVQLPINPAMETFPGTYNSRQRSNIRFVVCNDSMPCPTPNLLVTSVTGQDVSFEITAGGEENYWELEYRPFNDTAWTSAGLIFNTTPELLGLSTDRSYWTRVRALCSDSTYSTWISATFATECGEISRLPYSRDFEDMEPGNGSTNLDHCWSNLWNTSYYPPRLTSQVIYTPNNSVGFTTYANTDTTIVVLPKLSDTLNIQDLQLSFRASILSGTIAIGAMTDPSDLSTFVLIDSIDVVTTTSTVWRPFEVPLSGYSGHGKYVAIGAIGSAHFSIDDVVLDYIPSCPRTSMPQVTYTDNNSAVITWTENGTASQWEIEYGPEGFAQGQGTVVTATSNPFTLTGLQPSTGYDCYVRAWCASDDRSVWSPKRSFATVNCDSADRCPLQVILYYTGTDTVGWAGATLDIYADGLIAASLTLSSGQFTDTVLVPICPNAHVTESFNIDNLDPVYSYTVHNFSYISIFSPNLDILYDSVPCVDPIPWHNRPQLDYIQTCSDNPCFAPRGLTVLNFTDHSATLDWTALNGENSWFIDYKRLQDSVWTTVTSSGHPDSITGLSPISRYQVRLRATCNDDTESNVRDTATFTTEICSNYLYNSPFQDSIANIPSWLNWYHGSTNIPYSYSQNIYLSSEIQEPLDIFALEIYTLNPNTIDKHYDIYLGHTNKDRFYGGDFVPTESLTLVFSGTVHDTATSNFSRLHIQLDTVFSYNGVDNLLLAVRNYSNVGSATGSVPILNIGSPGLSIYYQSSSPFTTELWEALSHGINAPSGTLSYYKDVIRFPKCCATPYGVSVQPNATDTTATITWQPGGGESRWVLEYKPNSATEWTSVVCQQPSYLIADVAPSVQYMGRVMAVCDTLNDEGSGWVDFTFSVVPAAPTAYNIVSSAGPGGTILPTGNVNVMAGYDMTFDIVPDTAAGYVIQDVLVDEISQGPVPTYTFYAVDADHTIRAEFLNVGIDDLPDNLIAIYPNPTNGKLRIENGELTIDGVEVYDVYGKLLQTVTVNDVAADLDVSSLPAGLYFARIRTGNGVVTKRFVKR